MSSQIKNQTEASVSVIGDVLRELAALQRSNLELQRSDVEMSREIIRMLLALIEQRKSGATEPLADAAKERVQLWTALQEWGASQMDVVTRVTTLSRKVDDLTKVVDRILYRATPFWIRWIEDYRARKEMNE